MANDNGHEPGSLLQSLPGIYRQDAFLGRFLAAFEKILLGGDDGRSIPALSLRPGQRHGQPLAFQGLEESIAAIATLFIPFLAECVPLNDKGEISSHDSCTRDEFLPWLAQWAALNLRADLPEVKQREFIANAISGYSRRGTPGNLKALLETFSVSKPVIEEDATPPPQAGIGDKQMPPGSTHFFRVKVNLGNPDPELINHNRDIADTLIKFEKPAHTHYELEILFNTMQIFEAQTAEARLKKTAQIGKSTIIGVMPDQL
jgi:P2-related tail formation protein